MFFGALSDKHSNYNKHVFWCPQWKTKQLQQTCFLALSVTNIAITTNMFLVPSVTNTAIATNMFLVPSVTNTAIATNMFFDALSDKHSNYNKHVFWCPQWKTKQLQQTCFWCPQWQTQQLQQTCFLALSVTNIAITTNMFFGALSEKHSNYNKHVFWCPQWQSVALTLQRDTISATPPNEIKWHGMLCAPSMPLQWHAHTKIYFHHFQSVVNPNPQFFRRSILKLFCSSNFRILSLSKSLQFGQ